MIVKAQTCLNLNMSPREYEQTTINDLVILNSYVSAVKEKQQAEQSIGGNW